MSERVRLDDPPRASLLALLLRDLLAANAADDRVWTRAGRLRGDILVDAGGMRVTLRFAPDGVTVRTGAGDAKPRARVKGSLQSLLGMSIRGAVVGPVVSRKIRIGGNPFVLLKMLPLIRAPR